jgi:hypothetical protein
MLKVVIVEPGKIPYSKEIPDNLEEKQKIVGGWIEVVTMGETTNGNKLCIICNEEGKLQNLEPNRLIRGFDMMVGTFFISSYDKWGNDKSLTNPDCKQLIKLFSPLVIDFNSN